MLITFLTVKQSFANTNLRLNVLLRTLDQTLLKGFLICLGRGLGMRDPRVAKRFQSFLN